MTDTIAAAQLRAFVERIERIEADIKEMNADKSEVYKELRGVGFDVKAVRQCVAKRKLDDAERQEQESLFDMYWGALTGGPRVHVHEEQNSGGMASGRIDPSADRVSPPAHDRYPGSGSANIGGENVTDVHTLNTDKDGPNEGDTSLAAREGEKPLRTISDEDVPAFLRKPVNIRPHCLHPDLCAGYGRTHCGSCLKASSHSEAA